MPVGAAGISSASLATCQRGDTLTARRRRAAARGGGELLTGARSSREVNTDMSEGPSFLQDPTGCWCVIEQIQ